MNGFERGFRHLALHLLLATPPLLAVGAAAAAQTADQDIVRVALPVGRSYPITTAVPVTRVSVANPAVADVAVIGERDVVINARTAGETDVILWIGPTRRHYRVLVNPPTDRRQVSLGIIFAEVRRDALTSIGLTALYRDKNVRIGTGILRSDNPIDPRTGAITLPSQGSFLTALSSLGTKDFLALLEAEEQKGNARLLAQPTVMSANKQEANFLAGGEIPIPIAQPSQNGSPLVTILYREFGIRLRFTPEILSDSLITLAVRPEVSSLDYSNSVTISGFSVPALRTRRVETTVDVRPNQSLIISGLMSEDRSKTRTGIPLLMNIPILGSLFSSTRWQTSETELVVVVTPVIVDPLRARAQDILRPIPSGELPAREVLEDAKHPVIAPRPLIVPSSQAPRTP